MIRSISLTGVVVAILALSGGGAAAQPTSGPSVEVIVLLASPPLAGITQGRGLASGRIDREQDRFAAALRKSAPEARTRWRYRIVANGIAVTIPRNQVPRLRRLPGVRDVVASAAYPAATTRAASSAAARAWNAGLPNQGDGMKIAIIDDGIDQTHPYFAPSGYVMPPGFPRGQTAYTTAKVIVARAFPPPHAVWKNAAKPFDPKLSEHGTHVAGIAAGNAGTTASGGNTVSGVAPRAYLGNYKALTTPTDADVGLNGNAAELVAAIEAAVSDGMDVINLSIGEPEITPSRDLVATALDAAAAAGVVPVVAAGNDFDEFGRGSLASPGSSAKAITVAAVTTGVAQGAAEIASFSAAGPTPLSTRLKPDVSAPGVAVLSSVPGGWESMSGTSMAAPHVAGAVALLLERHPDWTVAQVKASLIETGDPVVVAPDQPAPPTRSGGGSIDPLEADVPIVLADPASVSLGFLPPGATTSANVVLSDAGGGAGEWTVSVESRSAPTGAGLTVPASMVIPGTLTLTPAVSPDSGEGEVSGYVVLSRGLVVRRVPFWFRVTRPALAAVVSTPLAVGGVYAGDTRGRSAVVSGYRYPEVPAGGSVTSVLKGPERVYRVTLRRPVANFGVAITHRDRGVSVEPRVVAAGDENRLTGYAALPLNLNPYLAQFGERVLAAGAVRPLAGTYDIVFDSASAAGAGRFSFRFWINDTTPPTARLERARLQRGQRLLVKVADAGSGVDAATLAVKVDGKSREAVLRAGVVGIATTGLRPGRHALRLQVSDYQESRNMENVPPILPNTRVLSATFVVQR